MKKMNVQQRNYSVIKYTEESSNPTSNTKNKRIDIQIKITPVALNPLQINDMPLDLQDRSNIEGSLNITQNPIKI